MLVRPSNPCMPTNPCAVAGVGGHCDWIGREPDSASVRMDDGSERQASEACGRNGSSTGCNRRSSTWRGSVSLQEMQGTIIKNLELFNEPSEGASPTGCSSGLKGPRVRKSSTSAAAAADPAPSLPRCVRGAQTSLIRMALSVRTGAAAQDTGDWLPCRGPAAPAGDMDWWNWRNESTDGAGAEAVRHNLGQYPSPPFRAGRTACTVASRSEQEGLRAHTYTISTYRHFLGKRHGARVVVIKLL